MKNIFIDKYLKIVGIFLLLTLTSADIKADPIEDFKNLIIEETEYFVLESVELDEEAMFLSAQYNYKPMDEKVMLYLEYGSADHIREVVSSFSSVNDITVDII